MNLTEVNSTVLEMTIRVNDTGSKMIDDETSIKYREDSINPFNWTVLEFAEKHIKFQLDFENLKNISTEIDQDLLIIRVLDAELADKLFQSNETSGTLHPDFYVIQGRIMPQLERSTLNK